ncbi:KH domain-containing protein [Candidatus Woesearchaeota archaeon]|nr:KH domain-containing protein [Candidatus Woesearchaeota archaeon]MBW2978722.1 KH domain-containing protein [Candidatus Woesearchaeota archaeon]
MASKEEYSYEVKIPKDRIAVLIGKRGEIKKQIEKSTKTQIQIDSKEGEIIITGTDAIHLYTCKEIIRAIGRGFNPEIAQQLLKQDYGLEIIPINARNKEDLERLKGRIIGQEGKSRKTIEQITQTNICVYGKTISIIGDFEGLDLSRRAINMLLTGSPHSNVFRMLEKRIKEVKR